MTNNFARFRHDGNSVHGIDTRASRSAMVTMRSGEVKTMVDKS
jgi:hypothetical protein